MRGFAQVCGDRRLEGVSLAMRGCMEVWAHQIDTAAATLREAAMIGDEGYDDVRALAVFWLGCGLMIFGRTQEAQPHQLEADATVPEVGDATAVSWWALMESMRREWRAEFPSTLEHIGRWRSAAQANLLTQVGILWTEAITRALMGEYQQGLALLNEHIATCDRTGEQMFRARALNTVGWLLGEIQNHEEALPWNGRSEEAALALGLPDPEVVSNARLNAGDSLMALGRLDEAEKYYQMVEEVVRNPKPADHFALWLYSQHFFHSYGELWLARGDHEKALLLADECIKLAESTNRPKNVVKGRRLKGQALLLEGKPPEAEPEIEMALGIAREIGNPAQLWKTLVALGELRKAQGEPGAAQKAYREAYSVIEKVAEGLTDEALREKFLTSPHVQGIREAAAAG
jgi:tetratricopeptide (TPR) repeat protein